MEGRGRWLDMEHAATADRTMAQYEAELPGVEKEIAVCEKGLQSFDERMKEFESDRDQLRRDLQQATQPWPPPRLSENGFCLKGIPTSTNIRRKRNSIGANNNWTASRRSSRS